MKKQYYLFALMIGIVVALACNGSDPTPETPLTTVALTAADYSFNDQGFARVENLNPNDVGSPTPTHVNYALTMVTKSLREVQFGDKTFFELDPTDLGDEVSAIAVNLYAPLTQRTNNSITNLLGDETVRVYDFENFSSSNPAPNDYFFLQGALITQSLVNAEDSRNYQFTGGTITIGGTSPDFTVSFDVEVMDIGRNIEGTFIGSVAATFRVEENN